MTFNTGRGREREVQQGARRYELMRKELEQEGGVYVVRVLRFFSCFSRLLSVFLLVAFSHVLQVASLIICVSSISIK